MNSTVINNLINNLNLFFSFITIKVRDLIVFLKIPTSFISKAIFMTLLMSVYMSVCIISNTQSMKQRYKNDISQDRSMNMIELDDFDARAHGISWIISIIGKEKYKSSGLGYHECFAICDNSSCKLYPEVFNLFKKLKIQQRNVDYEDEDAIGRLYEKVSELVNGTYSGEFDRIVNLIQKRHYKVAASDKKNKDFDTSGKKTAQSQYQVEYLQMQGLENKKLEDMKKRYKKLLNKKKADNKNAENEFIITQEDRKSFIEMMDKYHEDQELINLCGSIFLKAPLINTLSNLNFSVNVNKNDNKDSKLQFSSIKKSQIFGLMDIFLLEPAYNPFLEYLEGVAQNSTNEIFDTILDYENSILVKVVDDLEEKKIDNDDEDDLENMKFDTKRKTYKVLKEYINRVARYNGIFAYMVANQSSGLSEERYIRFLKQNVRNMPIDKIVQNVLDEEDSVDEEFKICAFRLYNSLKTSFLTTLNAYASMIVKSKYEDYLKKFKNNNQKLEHYQCRITYIIEFSIMLSIWESEMRLENNVTHNTDVSLRAYVMQKGNSWQMCPYRSVAIYGQTQQGYDLINNCVIDPIHFGFDIIAFTLRIALVLPATLASCALGFCKK